MKNKKLLLATVLAPLMLTCVTGCGGGTSSAGSSGQEGKKTIQVKMYKGGFGKDWFEQIAKKFTEYQKSKFNRDVEVKMLDYGKAIGDKAKNEILTVQDNVTDLYLLDGPDVHDIISQSERKLGTDEFPLLEPLDDVLSKGAIDFDGTVENKTIGERLLSGYESVTKYHNVAKDKWEGNTFVLPWTDAATGLICNTAALKGLGLEVPLTSDQLVSEVKTIASAKGGAVPFVYSGKDAPGYWNYLYNTWLAQYTGVKGFENFLGCVPEADAKRNIEGDGSIDDIADYGWTVYENKGLEKALEPMMEILDKDYCVKNSGAATYGDAQHSFAMGEAIFMANGDWLLKEMKDANTAYYERMKDFEMIRTPILSSIGTEIGLSNDAELQQLVKLIDERKSTAEIISAMNNKVNAEGVARVEEARSLHHGEGANHVMLIPSYSDTKDLAKELIRFIYSDDGCNLFNKLTYANLPLTYNVDKSLETNGFQRSVNALYDYAKPASVAERGEVNEVRSIGGFYFFNKREWAGPSATFTNIISNKASGTTKWTAKSICEEELTYVKSTWSTWMDNLGW